MMKKGWSRRWNPKNDDSHIPPAPKASPLDYEASLIAHQEAHEEPSKHDQENSLNEDDVIAYVKCQWSIHL
jgi:hypothetical protein